LVAILQSLKALADMAQSEGDAGVLACIAECILACLASILEYFNKWAFIYVGVYGFGYLEAGKSVFQLFQNRGWEAIIADVRTGGQTCILSSVYVPSCKALAILRTCKTRLRQMLNFWE
jgi:Plasma-membrane choline transporter